jgi:hypothetical protein
MRKRVGMSFGSMPFKRGFGKGTRYAVTFPGSRAWGTEETGDKTVRPVVLEDPE